VARRVVVISADRVGERMGGSGIRAYEHARALQPHADVVLAAPRMGEPADPDSLDVPLVEYDFLHQRALRPLLDGAEAVVAQPPWPHFMHELRRSGARLIFMLPHPEPLEVLEFARRRRPRIRRAGVTLTVDRMLDATRRGHHLACGSERQRDLWLGTLLAERAITPRRYDRDPTLRSVLDVVPFGIPAEPPRARADAVRERFPQIGADDEVVLWNGGVWSWLDAPTAVRAVAELARRGRPVRLVFMAGPTSPAARAATDQARAVARELGVLDDHVMFNDRWEPYERRADWLLAADCAISTHREHLETRFAVRTRVLDCLWAGLPVACTRGDELADRVERDGLGATAPEGDAAALADGVERILERGRAAYAEPLARAADDYRWERVAEPIVRWATAGNPLPPAIGTGLARRPDEIARGLGFRAAVELLRATGREWPRL
jgi:glycosyltransferase involved in cell wall biosynthesis